MSGSQTSASEQGPPKSRKIEDNEDTEDEEAFLSAEDVQKPEEKPQEMEEDEDSN